MKEFNIGDKVQITSTSCVDYMEKSTVVDEVHDTNGKYYLLAGLSGLFGADELTIVSEKSKSEPTKTLLDDFAMAALPLVFSENEYIPENARRAYYMAESMMAEKMKREQGND